MEDVIDLLKEERDRVEAERAKACEQYDAQIADIDAAISTIQDRRMTNPTAADIDRVVLRRQRLPIDDAVIEAVKNGVRSPSKILQFLKAELGVDTTINSVRTRLSRLKNEKRLAHDERGWLLPREVRRQLPLNGNGSSGEGPDENAEGADTPSAFKLQSSP